MAVSRMVDIELDEVEKKRLAEGEQGQGQGQGR